MKKIIEIKGKRFGEGRPLICLPVTKTNRDDIVAEVKRLVDMQAEVIEWRVDALEDASNLNLIRDILMELAPIVAETPLIYTFRSKEQGGLCALPADVIDDIHQVGAETKVPDFIDLEFFGAKKPEKETRILQEMGVYVIASHHDFDQTPEEELMVSILDEMMQSGADVVKLAVMPQDANDVLSLMNATNTFSRVNEGTLVITMSMGKLGMVSRVCGELTGSCLTFGSAGEASAPGQIECQKLGEILDVLKL